MSSFTKTQIVRIATAFGIMAVAASSQAQQPAVSTKCLDAKKQLCYCVSSKFESLINTKVAFFRGKIADARAKEKLAAYISIPLSTRGGGYFSLNAEIAEHIAIDLQGRFGSDSIYVLNPATPDGDLKIDGENASQSDYLYMWSSIIWGATEGSPDFDIVYFAGPNDFADALGVGEHAVGPALARKFEHLKATDANFASLVTQGKISKRDFIAYYSVRASAAVSPGAHDEWNTTSLANSARRSMHGKDGLATQVAMWFGGRSVEPADAEMLVSPGNVAACKPADSKAPAAKPVPFDPMDRRAY